MTTYTVSSGQIQSGMPLGSGDIDIVLSGGRTVDTAISSGGQEIVSAGGSAGLTTVSAGGFLSADGGALASAVIESGGRDAVYSGGVASFTTISSGGVEAVYAGGTVVSSLVMGTQLVSSGGSAVATINMGTEYVLSGGQAFNTVNDLTQIVSAGGVAQQTINIGQQFIYSGGTAVGTRDVGEQDVYSGGSATLTTVLSGGTQFVDSGGVATSAVVGSDGLVVVQGGSVFGATVLAVGEIDVHAGSTSGTLLSGLESLVGDKSTATASATQIASGGVQYVGNLGVASATLIVAGGEQFVDQGGSATTTVVQGGGLMLVRGASVTSGVVAPGGVASGTDVLKGGELQVFGTSGATVPSADIIGTDLFVGGTIDLAVLPLEAGATASIDYHTDVLTITDGGSETSLQLAGNYRGEFFHLTDDGAGGTDITVDGTPCYCRGTNILTRAGLVAVEQLQIGDHLITKSGEARALRWIGRRAYAGRFAAGNRDVLPVLFRAGSLGSSAQDTAVPVRDLYVSPLHAMYLEGVLIPAACLTNGDTIVQVKSVDEVEYFHLELDSHDIIVAEGALSESYLNDDNRGMFHNAAEYAALYPDARYAPEPYCAMRVEDGALLEAVRRRLNGLACSAEAPSELVPLTGWLDRVERGRIIGWARSAPANASDAGPVRLRIVDNGVIMAEVVANLERADVQAADGGSLACGFAHEIQGGLAPDRRHLIQVQRASDGAELPCSPRIIEALAVVPPAPALQPALRGNVDRIDHTRLLGWAQSGAGHASADPVALQILDNGLPIGRVLANRWRADVAEAGVGDGRHAFEFMFETPLSPLTRHAIELRRENDGAVLPSTPMHIAAADSFDPALEQTIRLAVAALDGRDRDRVLGFMLAQAEQLKQQGADAVAQREHRATWRRTRDGGVVAAAPGLRALVIDGAVPKPNRDAGSQAVLSHMRGLQRLGYEVSFVAAEQMDAADCLGGETITLCAAPYYASVEDVLRRQSGCFDLVYLHRADIAAAYMALARRWMPKARIVYAVADLHHLRLARQAEVEQRPELLAQSRRMRLAECTAAWNADAVLTHSPHEAALLRAAVPQADIHVVPWAVPARPTKVAFAKRCGLAFIGNYAHAPNVDAARFLVEEVMPLVWAQDDTIVCHLAGSAMPQVVSALAGKRVTVLGHVPDLATLFDTVRLTVAPLRFGAGIKGKVLDSLAAGIPCAATPAAAEGLALPPNLVGADPAALVAIILRLHRNSAANRAASRAGLALILQDNSVEQVDGSMRAMLAGRVAEAAAAG